MDGVPGAVVVIGLHSGKMPSGGRGPKCETGRPRLRRSLPHHCCADRLASPHDVSKVGKRGATWKG